MELCKGDLIRWIVDYKSYKVDSTGNATPFDPIYFYGLVVDWIPDGSIVIVVTHSGEYDLVSTVEAGFEIISSKIKNNKIK